MKDQAKEKVKKLARRFRYNLDVYKKPTYNETQARQEFINPFFEALGWDVSNKQGHAEQYKDVVHEDAIKIVDAQIDGLVYDLYVLTEEEIGIVEEE